MVASHEQPGRRYEDGEVVIREGEIGENLYVVQSGQVEVVTQSDGEEVVLRVVGRDELLGEISLFSPQVRSATVRARGPAQVVTLDRGHFLERISQDPSLAFWVLEVMSRRVRELSREVAELRHQLSLAGGKGEPSR